MEADKADKSEFYLTLPSNDVSKKYYPENSTRWWKIRLDHAIRLEGRWQVGLSSLSIPSRKIDETDGKLFKYLDKLNETLVWIRQTEKNHR